jgi:hypothetical protein
MRDCQRYRYNAARCLLAAQEARQPALHALHLSMAPSRLSLARQDEPAPWSDPIERFEWIPDIADSATPAVNHT